jgi:hypothetical protein
MNELLNLAEIDDDVREEMNRQKIDVKKFLSKFASNSREDAKSDKCLYCNKEITKFCNSHSVPASFLRNIAIDGKVYTSNLIIDLPLLDQEKGVNNSGTFHIICRDCDSKIFQDYESLNDFRAEVTSRMIAQIAMKNHLRSISKRRFEIALYENVISEIKKKQGALFVDSGLFDQVIEVSKWDLNEYYKGFRRAKKVIEKGLEQEYYLFFCKRLDYTVPLAFQCEVALHYDFNGYVINNVFVKDPKYKVPTLHVAVFPLKTGSIVALFIDKHEKRYRPFYKQFAKLTEEEQLAAINYIIFSLSEDVYLSKKVHDAISGDEMLKKINGLTSIQFSTSPEMNPELIKKNFSFSHMGSIPNFLLMNLN